MAVVVATAARARARRSLRRDLGEDLPLREQIERLERPLDWPARLDRQLGWWLRLWIAIAPLWPLPVAAVLSGVVVGGFSADALAGAAILPVVLVPLAAVRGHRVANKWRRGEWQAASWSHMGLLAALALVSLALRDAGLVVFVFMLVHVGIESILELHLRGETREETP
jgi:hypothetical protein